MPDLRTIIDTFIEEVKAAAKDEVREEVVADIVRQFSQAPASRSPRARRSPSPARARAAEPKPAPGRTSTGGGKRSGCGRCGKPGHNARTCAKSAAAADESDDADEPAHVVDVEPPPEPFQRPTAEPSFCRERERSTDEMGVAQQHLGAAVEGAARVKSYRCRTCGEQGHGAQWCGHTKPVARFRPKRSRPRSKTLALKRITQLELRAGALEFPPVSDEVLATRPRCRGDCAGGERPCPWISCKHHLYLDVNPETGSIKINFPDLEPDQLVETCALDVADAGGVTLEATGGYLNLTRERVRQVEVRALMKLNTPELREAA